MGKWTYREEGKRISQSILQGKTAKDLTNSRKFIHGLLELRKSQKLERTYIAGTKKAIAYNGTPKIYVDYRFDGTATGRLSCAAYTAAKPMGVSFHTLPRSKENNIRSLFTAPPDYHFITIDYAAMELRVLAHVAKEGNMQKAFNEGADLHTYTARLLFNRENITKEQRQIAKAVSFLIVYGGGPFNLAETTGISIGRAKKIIKNYQNVYPGIFTYMSFVQDFIKRNKYAYTIFGRRRNLPDVESKDFTVKNRAFRQGLNFTIQSTASDILLGSLLGVDKRLREEAVRAAPVATVHDSVEVICHKEDVGKCLEIIYDELVNYPFIKEKFNIHFDVPLKIDVEVGDSFGGGMEITFDADGKPQGLEKLKEV